jgi:hypothetical protein
LPLLLSIHNLFPSEIANPSPEVRKAGGVYYTPAHIIDYIVRQTVGRLCEGRTPKQVARLRLLDPACGSGLFLVGAYQYLLNWHLRWYTQDGASRHVKEIYQGPGGAWRLAIKERRHILLNNIYGVDIDPQAVEVTKLSLLSKVLEGESEQTLDAQLGMFRERALPGLGCHIKSGNSLIGSDFYDGGQMGLPGKEERSRIHAFDWEREFPEIMRAGGFDAVVSNPPYIFARDEGLTKAEKSYFRKFNHQKYQLNTFALFTEQSFSLLRAGGHLGFIIPNNWLSLSTMKPFRDFLVGSTGDLYIVNHLYQVFRGAHVDTSIIGFEKKQPTTIRLIESARPNQFTEVATVSPASLLLQEPIIQYHLYRNARAASLLRRLESKVLRLEEIALVKTGLKAYETGKGQPAQTDRMKRARVYHRRSKPDTSYRKYLEGRDVRRYAINWSGSYLKYGANLAAPRDPALFQGERILVRQIPSRLPYSINGAIVSGEELNDINSMVIKQTTRYALPYLLGIINSRLLTFWFDLTFDKFQRRTFPQFKVNELSRFPIRVINFSEPDDVAQHDQMVETVEQMLALNERLAEAKTSQERAVINRRIKTTDRRIDRLVYQLYELTEGEIRIVEGQTAR